MMHQARSAVHLATSVTLMLLATPATTLGQSMERVTTGLEFRNIGPAAMSGRIVDIEVLESNPHHIFIAAATGGVWETTNNGVTWSPIFKDEGTHSVGDIAVHQADTNIIWVGTGERANRQSSSWGDGVYKSTDGGRSWTNMGLHDSHHIGRIVLHPTDPNTIYVAALGHLWGPNEERGLYMSEDGGNTWTRPLFVDQNTGVVDVAMDPSDPAVMYAATYQRRRRPYGFDGGGPGSGLHKSTDGGRTWRKLTAGLPEGETGRIGISIYRSDPRIVYVSVEQGFHYNASTAYNERRAGIYRSDNKGETWQYMSDWNPRPMYASQPAVDPNNDQRIYMMNSFSYSDDGGKTFERARQSLHSDDRFLWVNPADSRNLIKADDGGLGISYDKGVTWLYMTNLPVSQYYRVAVDMRKPYWVYGGLQDNGSWMGPSATYRSEGILFEDWIKTGGGDGFVNLIDTTDNLTLYTESQYLGLSRVHLASGSRTWIRPDNARGAISPRRNWDAWGPGVPEPELANAMAPANWDGPFIISPHDHETIYAGTNQLWKSTDRGDTWGSLGDLTTGVNRRELEVMGRRAHDSTLSLDDGIPYYPTLTAVAESPLQQGLLFVGTDDGNLQISSNGGRDWTNVVGRLPALPPSPRISGIEPSRHNVGTVYVTVSNYRNDDFGNYVYKSTDSGKSWRSIVGDLPANRVARTIREDLRQPGVLYLGTELGLFYTADDGEHWSGLGGNLPTVAVNDLVIHPRDNDLILGTHGRGIWILDNINSLQELTQQVLASEAHLFTIESVEMIRYSREGGHRGDMIFRGANPARGAIIDYYLESSLDSADAITLAVYDSDGRKITQLNPHRDTGINRVIWDLHHSRLGPSDVGSGPPGPAGPWVLPGSYTVILTLGEQRLEQTLDIHEDPRIDVTDAVRREWHTTVQELAETIEGNMATVDAVSRSKALLDSLTDASSQDRARSAEIEEILPLITELRSRLQRLYGQIGNWPAPLTADQRSQIKYLRSWITRLAPRVENILNTNNRLK